MSKKKKKSKSKKSKKSAKAENAARKPETAEDHLRAAESRTAVAANVAWMLALMSTLLAEAIGLICRTYTSFVAQIDLLTVLSGILLLVAVVSGCITLIMIPIVYNFSKVKPPMFITQVAVIAGVLPLAALVLQYLQDN